MLLNQRKRNGLSVSAFAGFSTVNSVLVTGTACHFEVDSTYFDPLERVFEDGIYDEGQ